MKSAFALSALVALAAAIPDHIQTVLCTDPPTQTVTVTAECGSGSSPIVTGAPGGPGAPGAPGTITETVTEVQTVLQVSVVVNEGGTTTIYSTIGSTTTTPTPPPTGPAPAQTFAIEVGAFTDPNAPGGKVFQFRPNNITAAVGDVVEFNMLGANHSVTQSTFSKPCVKNGGFDTGFQANAHNQSGLIIEKFTVTDVSAPLWFYCRQDVPVSHCGTGMVFGINPHNNAQMESFIAMAIAQNGTTPAGSNNSTSTAISTPSSVGTVMATPTAMRFRNRAAGAGKVRR